MDPVEDSPDDLTHGIKPREFICPCGKSYLSYAALFTHIKQKHQGKAPGKIIKPPSMHPKRGRPPLKIRNQKNQSQNINPNNVANQQQACASVISEDFAEKAQRQQKCKEIIAQTARLINEMQEQNLNHNHLNEIQAFAEMTVHLNTRTSTYKIANNNICVGDGMIEFLQQVCQNLTWKQFQPLYILFILFLQYVIDAENRKSVITDSNLDILCEYLNQFIENNLKQMAEIYGLHNLNLLKYQSSTKTLNKFFTWTMHKKYVNYKITYLGEKQVQGLASSTTMLENTDLVDDIL